MKRQVIVLVVLILGLVMMVYAYEPKKAVGDKYGQDLSISNVIAVEDVFTKSADLSGTMIRVAGTVSDLCKHRGCWMQVNDGEKVITVRFKDEAFTLPASAIGRKVDFEGFFIAEAIKNPLDNHSGCAEGEHSGEGACENERAENAAKAADMRYTMISTGLILL